MNILDGKKLSNELNKNLEKEIFNFHTKPRLSIILVGNKPDSLVYVNMKKKKCQEIGIEINIFQLEEKSSFQTITNLITSLNHKKEIHGPSQSSRVSVWRMQL